MHQDTEPRDAEPPATEPGPPAWRRRLRRWLRPRLPFLSVTLQILLLLVILFADRIFIRVPAGEAGVLWNRFTGTEVDTVYGEGLHIISPLDRMTLYEVRKQVALHTLEVLSSEGLTLKLDLAIRYEPEYDLLGMLHERVGPEYLTRVVVPQTESVLRKELGTATAEAIYTNAGGLLTRAMLAAMDEIGRNFVAVEDIIIRRIELPESIRTAIEDKLTQQQLMQSYAYRKQTADREAERKRVEAGGISDYQRIVNETLSDALLDYQGIRATRDLAESENRKTVIIGAGGNVALPIFLDQNTGAAPPSRPAARTQGAMPAALQEGQRDPSDPGDKGDKGEH
ncbi:MAG: prohibitin family protein [Thiohalocapsa sp.]|uniref:prohibitin family protein n=1 Tax=Thiohalocapsa sp. TaxID=2497641 RepID=UPI0025CFF691|nr:prohibitin family protein [Thiohalocapsa sp.]MCG6940953.1 prohibitin family protein [Thiohalocapsa sp.]